MSQIWVLVNNDPSWAPMIDIEDPMTGRETRLLPMRQIWVMLTQILRFRLYEPSLAPLSPVWPHLSVSKPLWHKSEPWWALLTQTPSFIKLVRRRKSFWEGSDFPEHTKTPPWANFKWTQILLTKFNIFGWAKGFLVKFARSKVSYIDQNVISDAFRSSFSQF